jgi:predicted urease superfamily metal-dependent hydrolase
MKKLILAAILLSGCTVQLKDNRIDPKDINQITQVVQNQGVALQEIIKVLQEAKLIKEPQAKK